MGKTRAPKQPEVIRRTVSNKVRLPRWWGHLWEHNSCLELFRACGSSPLTTATKTQRRYKRRRFGKTKAPKTTRANQENSLRQTEAAKVTGAIYGSTTCAQSAPEHVGAPPRNTSKQTHGESIAKTQELEKQGTEKQPEGIRGTFSNKLRLPR